MAIKDVIKVLEQFDPDQEIICQVVGNKSGAWNMDFGIQKLKDSDFVVFTMSHPKMEYLPSDCSQPVTHYECNKGHRFLALPDHPVVMGAPLCPHCVAKGGVVIP